jgi:hypothetical protein
MTTIFYQNPPIRFWILYMADEKANIRFEGR